MAAGTASKTSGLIYLEAGKTYSFSGVADDSLLVTIGGKNVASGTWGAGGALNGSFTPTTSGYYTLDIYHHNQSGLGSYDVNLSVNGSTPIDLSSAGVPIYTGVQDLVNSGVTVSDLHGANGEGYYDGYKLNTEELPDLNSLRDRLISAITGRPADRKAVFIKGPRTLAYGEVVKVIDVVKQAGGQPIGLQIEGLDQ